MSTVAKKVIMGSGAVGAYEIDQSLIFDKASAAKLERTPSSGGNRRTFTISTWFKIGEAAVTDYTYYLYGAHVDGQNNDNSWFSLIVYNGDLRVSGWNQNWLRTNRVFRDHSAWYHVVVAVDTTSGTANNRVRIYINGVEETSFAVRNNPSQNLELSVNRVSYPQTVGSVSYSNAKYWDGYMAEYHLIDGTALTPSSFGETNSDTGQWVPKEYTGGSYGTNGFYQKYEKGTATDNPFLFEGDFTIEMFFKLTSMQVTSGYSYPVLLWLPPHTGVAASGSTGYKLQIDNGAAGYALYMYSTSPDEFFISAGRGAGAISLNTWYHTAIVREGMGSNNLSIYVNGSRISQVTYTGPVGSIGNTAYIGASGRNYGNFGGYINNLRIVKGTAVYSGSSFTVPTSNLSAISGTSLLALQGSGITDRLPASAPTLTAYDTGGGGYTPIIQSSISGTVGTYTGLFYKDGYNNGNGGGISFKVPGSIGKDSSGNSNDFTGASLFNSDVVTDTPSNNFATLNPIYISGDTNTFSEGNLKVVMATAAGGLTVATIVPTAGKYYAEFKMTAGDPSYGYMGVTPVTTNSKAPAYMTAANNSYAYYGYNGQIIKYPNDTVVSTEASYGVNDVIGIAIDYDNSTIKWYKNNALQYTQTSAVLTDVTFGLSDTSSGAGQTVEVNFGQKAFAYTPPSGYTTLSTANLPDPAIALPSAQFNTVLWAGNATDDRAITVGFAADLTWFKQRTGTNSNGLFDTVRGNSNPNGISSNSTSAPFDWTGIFKGHTSTGFTVGTDTAVNANSNTYVAWNWKANGSGSTDTSGDIDCVLSANPTAGFSILTFTGNNSNNDTIPHGLGVVPDFVWYKAGDSSWENWIHSSVISGNKRLLLQSTAAASSINSSYLIGGEIATSSMISNNGLTSSQAAVVYCFASKEGYSKVVSYTGNGSADGPFVNCGFRPAWLIIKRTTGVGDWALRDNKRDPDNVSNTALYANYNIAEGSTSLTFDILSNGFKLRSNHVEINGNNDTYIVMAFAESPFKTATAR